MSPELALQHAIVLTLRELVAGLRPGRTTEQVPLLLQVSCSAPLSSPPFPLSIHVLTP